MTTKKKPHLSVLGEKRAYSKGDGRLWLPVDACRTMVRDLEEGLLNVEPEILAIVWRSSDGTGAQIGYSLSGDRSRLFRLLHEVALDLIRPDD